MSVPRMSKKRKQELAFFLNERGRVAHNDTCRKCVGDCKQSFRTVIVCCPCYESKRSRRRKIRQKEFVIGLIEQALAEYEAQNQTEETTEE